MAVLALVVITVGGFAIDRAPDPTRLAADVRTTFDSAGVSEPTASDVLHTLQARSGRDDGSRHTRQVAEGGPQRSRAARDDSGADFHDSIRGLPREHLVALVKLPADQGNRAVSRAAEGERRQEILTQERKRSEEQEQQVQARQARHQQILAELRALVSREQQERRDLLSSLFDYQRYQTELERYLGDLHARGGDRDRLDGSLAQESRKYDAELARTRAILDQDQNQLRAVGPKYEQERQRLQAELDELEK